MDNKVLEFLAKHRVCSLATLLPDESPHAAALHYSHQGNPLKLFFSTTKSSKKCQTLLEGKISRASIVVGFSEKEWLTLQMDGNVKVILDPKELKLAKSIHYPKHPDSQQYEYAPETIFLEFTPDWWRFTDFNTDPETILSSEN